MMAKPAPRSHQGDKSHLEIVWISEAAGLGLTKI